MYGNFHVRLWDIWNDEWCLWKRMAEWMCVECISSQNMWTNRRTKNGTRDEKHAEIGKNGENTWEEKVGKNGNNWTNVEIGKICAKPASIRNKKTHGGKPLEESEERPVQIGCGQQHNKMEISSNIPSTVRELKVKIPWQGQNAERKKHVPECAFRTQGGW